MRKDADGRTKRWSWAADLSGASLAFVLEAVIVVILIVIGLAFASVALAVF